MNNLIKYLSQIKKIIKEKYLCDIKIKIETINNPGWSIKVSSHKIVNIKKLIPEIDLIKRTKDNWIKVIKHYKDNDSILLLGGPRNLRELLNYLFKYLHNTLEETNDKVIEKLENWYLSECREEWEYDYGIDIELIGKKWRIKIDLNETYLEEKEVKLKTIYKKQNNKWHYCYLANLDHVPIDISKESHACFIGEGTDLEEILKTFINFSDQYKYLDV